MRYTTIDFANLQKAEALHRKIDKLGNTDFPTKVFKTCMAYVFEKRQNAKVLYCEGDNVTICWAVFPSNKLVIEIFEGLLSNNPKYK